MEKLTPSGSTSKTNGRTVRAWWVYLAINAALIPIYFLATRGIAQHVLFYAYGVSSAVAIICGVSSQAPARARAWLFVAVGLLLFALGDVAFDVYASSGVTPVPSLADVLYLGAYPALAAGTALFARSRAKHGDIAAVLDGAIVAIGAGVAAWVFLMKPYADDRTLTVAAQAVPIAYPALDLLLIAVVARLMFGRGSRAPAFRLLAIGLVALLIADGLFAFATLHGTYRDGSVVDLGWLLCYALLGAAALHPSMSRLTQPSADARLSRGRLATVTLAAAALTAPVMLMIQDARGENNSVMILAAMSGVTFLLVLARVSIATRALDAAYRRVSRARDHQRVVTEAAVALLGAGDVTAAVTAAVEAAAALAADRSGWSAYATIDTDAPSVLATVGISRSSSRAQLAQQIVHTWAASTPPSGPELVSVTDEPGPGPGLASSAEHIVAAPIMVNDALRGVLLVGDVANPMPDFVPLLVVLSSQLSLRAPNRGSHRGAAAPEQRTQVPFPGAALVGRRHLGRARRVDRLGQSGSPRRTRQGTRNPCRIATARPCPS